MLKKKNSLSKIRLLSVLLLCYLSIQLSPPPIRLADSVVTTNRSITQKYVSHNPIAIHNDSELAAVANSGTGTATDPYIIAGWHITGSPTHGISITGTTLYFIIENCWIDSSARYGIFVDNVSTGTTAIINNTCNDNYIGIYLEDSGSSTIANNICNNNNYGGIRLEYSANSTIASNTCTNNGGGIYLSNSNSSTVVNNTCNSNN